MNLDPWLQAMRDGAGAWSDQLESGRHAPEFIEKIWPPLFMMALDEQAKGPLLSLCKVLRDTFGDELPQRVRPAFLPASVLGKLTLWASSVELENWPVAFQSTLAALLQSSPQQVPATTWATVLQAGGWGEWGLSILDGELPKAPWYGPQMSRWLEDEGARGVALQSLCSLPKGWVENAVRLGHVWAAWPRAHRSTLVEVLSEHWCHENWKQLSKNPRMLRHTLEVYDSLVKAGASLEGTAWPAWWHQRATEPEADGPFNVSLSCLRFAADGSLGRMPVGVAWSPRVAERWARLLGQSLLENEERIRTGFQPNHEAALCAIMELDRWMTGWGLQTPASVQAFEQALAQVRPNWEELLVWGTPNLNNGDLFATMRSEWKARRLDRLETPSAPAKVRPRM